MTFGRFKTRKRVLLKLMLVWCLSFACALPLLLMYATGTDETISNGSCQIPTSLYQIIGSVIVFYIPLIIMIVTYALTVRLLSEKKIELINKSEGRILLNSFEHKRSRRVADDRSRKKRDIPQYKFTSKKLSVQTTNHISKYKMDDENIQYCITKTMDSSHRNQDVESIMPCADGNNVMRKSSSWSTDSDLQKCIEHKNLSGCTVQNDWPHQNNTKNTEEMDKKNSIGESRPVQTAISCNGIENGTYQVPCSCAPRYLLIY